MANADFVEVILFFCLIVVLAFLVLLFMSWSARQKALKRRLGRQLPQGESLDKIQHSQQKIQFKSNYIGIFWFAIVPIILLVLLSFLGLLAFAIVLAYYLILTVGYIIRDLNQWRERSQFIEQLRFSAEVLVEQLVSGNTLLVALTNVSQRVRDPLKTLLIEIQRRVEMGVDLGQVMDELVNAHPYPPFIEFGLILKVHDKTGADIVPQLEALVGVIDTYSELQEKTQTATEQGRIGTVIIGLVPFAAIGFIYLAKPDLLAPVWAASGGRAIFLLCGFMLLFGILSVYKTIRVKM